MLHNSLATFCRSFARMSLVRSTRPIHLCTTLKHPDVDSFTPTSLQTQGDVPSIIPPRPPLPIITTRQLQYPPQFMKPRQAWVENLDTADEVKLGVIDLHPLIFATTPRLDILHSNVVWQNNYRRVSYAQTQSRAEVRGGGRKPWPQKGLGRARHGSIRSPLFKGGGRAHGPRGPKTYFYMLPFYKRLKGLLSTFSIKFAQDDLHIVDTLDIPTDDPKFIEHLIKKRRWGPSVLMVDDLDMMPRNISLATDSIKHVNLMPVYGLNVVGMLKHDTLVLTLAAVERIEERLLFQLNRLDVTKVDKVWTNAF